jgi:hypothetical protein
MTKIITAKEIRRAFTEKVNEYLAQGMEISIRTMSGSQGEVSKVDLTDGKFIYRIRLDREHKMFDEDFFYGYCDTIELTVEKFEDSGRNEFDAWETLWSGKGELIEAHTWYSLDRDKTAFVDSMEEMGRIFKVRDERRACRRVVSQKITDDRRIALVHKMVKKHKGYASVNKKAIEKVVREGGYNFRVFFTAESKKGSLRV